MESYWPNAPEDPQATKSIIKFAHIINSIPKIVFSKTLNTVTWNNTKLIKDNLTEEVLKLKGQSGNRIAIGSISLASHFIKLDLIDEYWFSVHPIISGGAKHLVEGIKDQHNLKLSDIKKFNSGVVVLHYKSAG
jgi:dihydrofolate reductase